MLMPTGGGKSLCYQLPALVFDGLTLVISPLIALMKDQVDALNANGIAARFINSSLPATEIERVQAQVLRREVKILYAAPERLALPGFRHFLHNLDLDLIAIDEAHCISEWGHEFRPDYRNLKLLREEFPAVPVIALTATATEQVRRDIIGQLGLQRGQVFLSSFNRSNLSYSVQPKSDSWRLLLTLLRKRPNQSTIIYCFSRRETEELAEDLNQQGLPARPYHAGLDGETRRRTQEDFIRDRVPIIVATIAFGMGIDKPDIRLVVHYSLPRSLEGYYQETGRAGRDGTPSDCVLFFTYADKAKQDYFINQIEDESGAAECPAEASQDGGLRPVAHLPAPVPAGVLRGAMARGKLQRMRRLPEFRRGIRRRDHRPKDSLGSHPHRRAIRGEPRYPGAGRQPGEAHPGAGPRQAERARHRQRVCAASTA